MKQVSENFDEILIIIKSFPHGASSEDILHALTSPLSKRSLQRHLASLLKSGHLKFSGNARSRRYELAFDEKTSITPSQEVLLVDDDNRTDKPDPFRLRYRNLIIDSVGEIIRKCMTKQEAVAAIKKKANQNIAEIEQAKFLEVVETELMSLHKGNIARFRLRPSEYDAWLKTWH